MTTLVMMIWVQMVVLTTPVGIPVTRPSTQLTFAQLTLAVPFVDLELDFLTNGGVGNKAAFW